MEVLTGKDDKKGYWVNSNYSSVSVLLKAGPRLSKLAFCCPATLSCFEIHQ